MTLIISFLLGLGAGSIASGIRSRNTNYPVAMVMMKIGGLALAAGLIVLMLHFAATS